MNALAIKARKDRRGRRSVKTFVVKTNANSQVPSPVSPQPTDFLTPKGKPTNMDAPEADVKREPEICGYPAIKKIAGWREEPSDFGRLQCHAD
jgi:hypothetical protein